MNVFVGKDFWLRKTEKGNIVHFIRSFLIVILLVNLIGCKNGISKTEFFEDFDQGAAVKLLGVLDDFTEYDIEGIESLSDDEMITEGLALKRYLFAFPVNEFDAIEIMEKLEAYSREILVNEYSMIVSLSRVRVAGDMGFFHAHYRHQSTSGDLHVMVTRNPEKVSVFVLVNEYSR